MTTLGRIVTITDPDPTDDIIDFAKQKLAEQSNPTVRFFVHKNYELRDPETGEIQLVCQVGAKWDVDVDVRHLPKAVSTQRSTRGVLP